MSLDGTQRKYLRGLAHDRKPLVHIGRQGLSESLLANLEQALGDHELVKVKFLEHRDRKAELCAEIERRLDCDLAGRIGHVAIFFRPAREPEKRSIALP